MEVVSMHQAKSTLSQLVKRAAGGETILIGAYGKVEAKLVPMTAPNVARKRIGILAGKLIVWVTAHRNSQRFDSFVGNRGLRQYRLLVGDGAQSQYWKAEC